MELGRVPLPGIDGLVETFRVVGVGPRRSPIEGLGARPLSRFVGRDLEMTTLHDVLDQVAVSGEASARRALGELDGFDEPLFSIRNLSDVLKRELTALARVSSFRDRRALKAL